MAYSQTINLVTGDTLPELVFTLKDSRSAAPGKTLDENDSSTWEPIDVAGATVHLRIRELGSTSVKNTIVCRVINGPEGKVATDFPPGTLDKAGIFEGELEITFASGGIKTVHDLIKLKVRSDFD